MKPAANKTSLVLVAALVMACLLASAWVRPLMLPDEGRYVGVAWEMLRSGDWLTPTLDGLPYFHKPPLFYWITASAMALFGPHEWAARLAPVLGATVGAVSLFAFAQRWSDSAVAKATLVALVAQPLFLVGGQFANLDMLVAGLITATITLLAHAALSLEQGQAQRWALLGGYAMGALAVLAKGLIGAVIPTLVIVAWLLLRGRWRTLVGLISLPGLLIFFALSAPWFVAMHLKFPDFLHYFFVVQHFTRFSSGGFNNAQPFWFFPAVLALFFLPWLLWMGRPLVRRPAPGQAPVLLLMGVWALTVILFFSMPRSKLVGYILPALAPLVFFVAHGFVRAPSSAGWGRRAWVAVAALSVLLSLSAVVYLSRHPDKSTWELSGTLRAQRQAGEPVVMFNNYYFDLPFHARLRDPVVVVDDWTGAAAGQRDDSRKELIDAGKFAPALATALLVERSQLMRSLCAAPVSWLIGPASAAQDHPWLAGARLVATHRDVSLWKVEAGQPEQFAVMRCGEGPRADAPPR